MIGMAGRKERAKLIPMAHDKRVLRETIKTLAEDSSKVFIGPHAKKRMAQRGITNHDVFRALKFGNIHDSPRNGDAEGEVVVKVEMMAPNNSRTMGVVTAVKQGQSLFIVTVEWEDR